MTDTKWTPAPWVAAASISSAVGLPVVSSGAMGRSVTDEKHALDAFRVTDALANAEALNTLHKRAVELTELYRRNMAAMIDGAAALSNEIDKDDRRKWLDVDVATVGENAFDDWASLASTARERAKREG